MNEDMLNSAPQADELQGVLRLAVDGIRATPPPDVDPVAWQARVETGGKGGGAEDLRPPCAATHATQRKRRRQPLFLLAVATAAAICVWLGIGVSRLPLHGPGSFAIAETVARIQQAKTITWKTTFYEHVASKDGKRTWLKAETRQQAYKSPGLYRETSVDEKGQVKWVEIKDTVQKKQLNICPGKKEAVLSEFVTQYDPRGPFAWVKSELQHLNLQWVETRKTALGEVNVFRRALRDEANGKDWSYDFWIDKRTKQLVEVHVPGADIYDPENDPARNTPPEKQWSTSTVPGHASHDIVLDADVDDSLFRLESPAGYAVEIKHRDEVTEKEMVDYLGILADFNDKTFPDHVFPFDISSDRVNRAWYKPTKERTAAEQKLVEARDHYAARFCRMPIGLFVEDHAVEDSFRYLGKGVKLGDKDRIVCWYKLKDAKNSNTYRAVYGDLSVKDVAAKDLPLPVEP